ncbi:ATP-binding cassette domain-containing protein [Kribbella sp. NPDC050124]|uniref:ATP-binding cassette domain-containing protein n=1 Tax=Kribbella sp. NPDC050124 TaxID=3364114 RepID=UPI00378BB9D0
MTAEALSIREEVPALELRQVSKHYGGVTALAGVSLSVCPGEVVALVGDNGAGKSTLVKTISGIVSPDSGVFYRDGQEVSIASPQDAASVGIQTVYQDLALCDNLDTVQNLFLGRELRGRRLLGGRLRRADMEHRTRKVLADLGVTTLRDISIPVGGLSGGQRQSVAICRSVLWDPGVVLLDEPTAALGVAQREQVLNLIRRLRDAGRAVILVSHDLADVQQIADRVLVLRLGSLVAEFTKDGYTREQCVAAITGMGVES